MLKRILLCAFLLTAAFRAGAVDYTDLYYVPAEGGWGVNVVQSEDFLFVTFFIYGPDNKPTWYTAQLTLDASGNYSGNLYAATGTYYAMPWKASDLSNTPVGTASFKATSPYTATLAYTVTTPPALAATVTKALQRQPLTAIGVGGHYFGVAIFTRPGCEQAGGGVFNVDLQVTQTTDGSPSSIAMNYIGGATCTFTGFLTHWGKLYQMPSATYVCSDTGSSIGTVDEINATSHGLEFVWNAPVAGDSCTESGMFSGLLN